MTDTKRLTNFLMNEVAPAISNLKFDEDSVFYKELQKDVGTLEKEVDDLVAEIAAIGYSSKFEASYNEIKNGEKLHKLNNTNNSEYYNIPINTNEEIYKNARIRKLAS